MIVKSKAAKRTAVLLMVGSASLGAQASDGDATDGSMELSLESLLTLSVTTATKTAQSLSEAPSIVSVITRSEIRNSGANTLFQLLETVPGFTPIRQKTSERLMVVRGLGLKDGLLVLVDGVTVNDAFDGSFDFYERTVDDIERIEIIRGPGSALYGGYAVSGVVQIFTRHVAEDDEFGLVRAGGGSDGQASVALAGGRDLSEYVDGLRASASFSYYQTDGDEVYIERDELFEGGNSGNYLPPLENPSLTPTTRQEYFEKYNAHINMSFHGFDLKYMHSQIISEPLIAHSPLKSAVVEEGASTRDSILDRLSLDYSLEVSENLTLDPKFYWVRSERKLHGQSQPPFYAGDVTQNGLNEEFPTGIIENIEHVTVSYGLELGVNYVLEKHNLVAGLVYDSTELKDASKEANYTNAENREAVLFPAQDVSESFIDKGIDRKFSALYLQDLWSLSDDTTVTLGVRYGDYSDFGETLTPRLGLVHRLNEGWYTKLLWGQAFKPPAFAQLYDKTPVQSANDIRGNTDLNPTEIETLELQVGYDFAKGAFAATVFRNETEDEIFFNKDDEQWQNSGARKSTGIELEVKGKVPLLDYAYANYSYQKTTGVDEGLAANIHPPHRFNLGARYSFSQDKTVNLNLSYFSEPDREVADTRDPVDDKTMVSLTFNAKDVYDKLDAELRIQNLLDEDARDQTEKDDSIQDDIPIEGLSIRFGINYDI